MCAAWRCYELLRSLSLRVEGALAALDDKQRNASKGLEQVDFY